MLASKPHSGGVPDLSRGSWHGKAQCQGGTGQKASKVSQKTSYPLRDFPFQARNTSMKQLLGLESAASNLHHQMLLEAEPLKPWGVLSVDQITCQNGWKTLHGYFEVGERLCITCRKSQWVYSFTHLCNQQIEMSVTARNCSRNLCSPAVRKSLVPKENPIAWLSEIAKGKEG